MGSLTGCQNTWKSKQFNKELFIVVVVIMIWVGIVFVWKRYKSQNTFEVINFKTTQLRKVKNCGKKVKKFKYLYLAYNKGTILLFIWKFEQLAKTSSSPLVLPIQKWPLSSYTASNKLQIKASDPLQIDS